MSKGLKALENIGFEPLCENEDGSYWRARDENKEDFDIIEKELKALEIIINKRLNVDEIYHKDYEWYMLDHKNDDICLLPTKEEYDLLKEVLL